MSFYSIKDRDARDRTIAEYIALKKKIIKRNEDEHAGNLDRYRELEETYKPIVESHAQMTRDVVDQIQPITEKLTIKQEEERPKIGVKRRMVTKNGSITEKFIQRYMQGDATLDKSFGLRYENNNFKIGNKTVQFQGNNIVIDREVYVGTPGLWSLIVDERPKGYDANDFERYKELLHETSALRRHYEPSSSLPRASKSKKWTKLLSHVWTELKSRDITDSESDEDEYETASMGGEGDGLKMYLQKHGQCYGLKRKGNEMSIAPRPQLAGTRGRDGLYVRVGSSLYDGHGLLLGSKSPFRNIPILGWLL